VQQLTLMVHKARHGLVVTRTACTNCIRGRLSKFGIVPSLKAEFSGRLVLQA
jgi:transposase